MCATNHDGTCEAVLSRDTQHAGRLIATLVCQQCSETLRVLGVYEYQVQPALIQPALIQPELALEMAAS